MIDVSNEGRERPAAALGRCGARPGAPWDWRRHSADWGIA